MKPPTIPPEFNKIVREYFPGVEEIHSSDEDLLDEVLGTLTDSERAIARDYLDELLTGKYSEEDLRTLWRASQARLLPFWGEEGSCTEFLQFMRSRMDEFERSQKP